MKHKRDNTEFKDFEEELGAQIGVIDSLNITGLNEIKNFKVLQQVLLKQESKRLTRKLGEDHPRVNKLKAGIKENINIIKELEVELEIAKIEVPEIPENGALVHGRISDKTNRGIAGLSVFAQNEKGKTLHAFGNAETNASGYYAIQIEEVYLKELKKTDIFLTVATRQGKIIPREKELLLLQPSIQLLVNITLDRNIFTSVTKPTKSTTKKPTVKEGSITEKGEGKTIKGSANKDISKIDVKELKGVGPKTANKLYQAGIKDIQEFLNTPNEKLEELVGKASLTRVNEQNKSLIEKVKESTPELNTKKS